MLISGIIAEADGVSAGNIYIEDGKIKELKRGEIDLNADYIYDNNHVIFPGFVDINCNEPEITAAYNGGITSIIDYGCYIEHGKFANNNDLGKYLRDKKKVVFKWRDPDKIKKYPDDRAVCEVEGIRTAITMTKIYGLQSRIVISTAESLELVQQAKDDGFDILAEVHPCNLYFDDTMLSSENRWYIRTNPPIRSKVDRVVLLDAFARGQIDILSSGHTPHLLEHYFAGVPELDTFGSLVAWLIREGVKSSTIFEAVCLNPAKWCDADNIGRIIPGYRANLTVIAFDKSAIDCRRIYTSCGWSPYDLRHLKDSIEMVMVDGVKVVKGQWMI